MNAQAPSKTLLINAYGKTDIGQYRPDNEDSLRFFSSDDTDFAYALVADGMGGYRGGALASQIASDVIAQSLMDLKHITLLNNDFLNMSSAQQCEVIRSKVILAINHANQAILKEKQTLPQFSRMGTTLVMVLIWMNHVLTAHIGDSRAYRWSHSKIAPLTKDHSVVQEMMDSGSLTPEEARTCNFRNYVTRALGIGPTVEPTFHHFTIKEDNRILICSDGLTEYFSEHSIESVLSSVSEINACCQRFIDEANQLGGRDNITVGLLDISIATTQEHQDKTIKSDVTYRGPSDNENNDITNRQ